MSTIPRTWTNFLKLGLNALTNPLLVRRLPNPQAMKVENWNREFRRRIWLSPEEISTYAPPVREDGTPIWRQLPSGWEPVKLGDEWTWTERDPILKDGEWYYDPEITDLEVSGLTHINQGDLQPSLHVTMQFPDDEMIGDMVFKADRLEAYESERQERLSHTGSPGSVRTFGSPPGKSKQPDPFFYSPRKFEQLVVEPGTKLSPADLTSLVPPRLTLFGARPLPKPEPSPKTPDTLPVTMPQLTTGAPKKPLSTVKEEENSSDEEQAKNSQRGIGPPPASPNPSIWSVDPEEDPVWETEKDVAKQFPTYREGLSYHFKALMPSADQWALEPLKFNKRLNEALLTVETSMKSKVPRKAITFSDTAKEVLEPEFVELKNMCRGIFSAQGNYEWQNPRVSLFLLLTNRIVSDMEKDVPRDVINKIREKTLILGTTKDHYPTILLPEVYVHTTPDGGKTFKGVMVRTGPMESLQPKERPKSFGEIRTKQTQGGRRG